MDMSSFLSFFLSLLRSYARRHVSRPRALLSLPEGGGGGGGWHDASAGAPGGRGRIGATEAKMAIDCAIRFFDCPSLVDDDVAAPAVGTQSCEQAVPSAGVAWLLVPRAGASLITMYFIEDEAPKWRCQSPPVSLVYLLSLLSRRPPGHVGLDHTLLSSSSSLTTVSSSSFLFSLLFLLLCFSLSFPLFCPSFILLDSSAVRFPRFFRQ